MSNHRHEAIDVPFGEYLWPIFLPNYWILILPVMLLGTSLYEIAATSELKPDAAPVPTFYAPDTGLSGDTGTILFFIALPIVATTFGALHLIAWNFEFPSHIEQLLWRIAFLTITGIPAAPLALELAAGALFIALYLVGFIIIMLVGFLVLLAEDYAFRLPDWSVSLPERVEIIVSAPIYVAIIILVEVIGTDAGSVFM